MTYYCTAGEERAESEFFEDEDALERAVEHRAKTA